MPEDLCCFFDTLSEALNKKVGHNFLLCVQVRLGAILLVKVFSVVYHGYSVRE